MRNKKISLLGLLLFLTLSSVSAGELNKLVGTYSAKMYGDQIERYRIEKHGSKFWLFEKKYSSSTSSKWHRAHAKGAVKIIDKKQFNKIMKRTVSVPAVGLNFNDRVAIFKVNKGFTIGRFKTASGYFVFYDGIFMDLKKVK